jgi:lipoic acid synthetase
VSSLRARWLGRVPYREADDLQRALLERAADDYLLLLEHPHVYTLGTQADPTHVLVPPASVGADLVRTDRGGDVTYHGPGQLVGYPILTLPEWRDGKVDVVAYVRRLEDVLIDTLADLGVRAQRAERYTGVWVGDEKIGAIGVKVARGRTRHGFALNVDPAMEMFDHIVPCGISDKGVTSLAQLLDEPPSMREVVDAVVRRFSERFCYHATERQDVAWRPSAATHPLPDGSGARAEPLLAAPPGLLGSSSRVSARPAASCGERPTASAFSCDADGRHATCWRSVSW